MMRGHNRDMRRMIDKMGLDMTELPDVVEVVIRTATKEIVISKPQVTEMKAKGVSTFAVVAEDYEERERDVPAFKDEDIALVREQTGVDEQRAIEALTDSKGDIAQAIMTLSTG